MTEQEIKQAVEEYFNEMLVEDADYFDNVTDSWINDAEEWCLEYIEDNNGIKVFDANYEITKEAEELCAIFGKIARKRFDELYDRKYGKRDALYELNFIVRDIKGTKKRFESIKHNLKEFPKLNDAITSMLTNLEGCLEALEKIEIEKKN